MAVSPLGLTAGTVSISRVHSKAIIACQADRLFQPLSINKKPWLLSPSYILYELNPESIWIQYINKLNHWIWLMWS